MKVNCKMSSSDESFKVKLADANRLGVNFGEYVLRDDYQTYMLIMPDGTEVPAVAVNSEMVFDATANDIREGKVAATGEGVTTGEKVIPSYHTTEAVRLISSGSAFETMQLSESDKYNFTKLQAIICPYEGGLDDSTAAEKVVIDENVYAVNSNQIISKVIRDSEKKTINLGITNESERLYLLRYFTYREIY